MAEPTPAPNSDQVRVQIGTKSVGLTTTQLPFVAVLIIVAGLGVYRVRTHDERLATIDSHLQAMYARQDSHRAEIQTLILNEMNQLRAQLRAQTELIGAEGQQVRASLRENRETTGARLQKQDERLDAQTDEVRRQHAIILYNMSHSPEQHLSLDLPLPVPDPLPPPARR